MWLSLFLVIVNINLLVLVSVFVSLPFLVEARSSDNPEKEMSPHAATEQLILITAFLLVCPSGFVYVFLCIAYFTTHPQRSTHSFHIPLQRLPLTEKFLKENWGCRVLNISEIHGTCSFPHVSHRFLFFSSFTVRFKNLCCKNFYAINTGEKIN